MSRYLACLAFLLWGVASAQTIAVPAIDGPGGGTGAISELQGALKKQDFTIHTTKSFLKEVKRQGVRGLPGNRVALASICAALKVDLAVYGKIVPGRGRGADAVLELAVYDGRTGESLDTTSVTVPKGKLKAAVYAQAASAVEAVVRQAKAPPALPVDREDEPVEAVPEPVLSGEQTIDEEDAPLGERGPVFELEVGLAALSRAFAADFAGGANAPFAEGGIEYASSLVPGVAIDARFFPGRMATSGAAGGFGLGVRFEKVFLSTEQKVKSSTPGTADRVDTLDTSHHHFLARLLYEHRFGGDSDPSIRGEAGFGLLAFTVEHNEEYDGATYRYLEAGLSGRVPLGTPLAALEARVAYLPWADLGDTQDELGATVTTNGFVLAGGIASTTESGFTARAEAEFTSLTSDVAGEGRDGREGESASDHYLGFRVLAGYRF